MFALTQFSLRGLLIAVSVCAVFSVIASSIVLPDAYRGEIRDLPPFEKQRLASLNAAGLFVADEYP